MMIHALEGSMISSRTGMEKLLRIYRSTDAGTTVFVVSHVSSADLSLDSLASAAAENDERLWSRLERSQNAWNEAAEAMLGEERRAIDDLISASFSDIEEILKALWIIKSVPEAAVSHLERLTGALLAEIAAERFRMEGIEASVSECSEAVKSAALPEGAVFVSGKLYDAPNTYDAAGRIRREGGSEYTASLIASAHHASLTFWNSKSLLCSASRRDVPSSSVIEHLTYDEATELSFFGAPIIHPHSFQPASQQGLEIYLRYWGDIDEKGTLISKEHHPSDDRTVVKAFSVVRNIALINLEGSGMSGVPGISSRLFTALRSEGISVILISQASSEYSICFAIPQKEAQLAQKTVRKEFAEEIASGAITTVGLHSELAILAAVGEGMPGRVGVAGKFFSSLARSGVNILAIAQGSSERNISVVIKAEESGKALRSLHSAFFLSAQTLSIGLFGPGNIGGTLLDQIAKESDRLRREFDLDIRIRGIASSKKMLLSEEGIDLSSWREQFEKNAVMYREDIFLSHINASYYPHAVIVDCTSSEERAKQYLKFINQGLHVITPNKKAGSGSYEYYKKLEEATMRTGRKFLYETTVGAGLPIICTLKDLRETGDTVHKVEGIVSGTLAWLFSSYDGKVPFSSLVLKAKELGYTEPDPRDDLSGMDVARKTVILARELGYETEISDISVQSLVPEALRNVSKDEFMSRLTELDEPMAELFASASEKGMVIRYVGKVEDGVCTVSLAEYPAEHAFAQAKGTDNVIAFSTARYNKEPLVIKGPGAGPEVTAGGVFADILRLSAYLGSKI